MLEQIKSIYTNRTPHILGHESVKRAAVMVPLMDVDGQLSVLFQVRGHRLRHQPGEICFPGGRIEPDDLTEQSAAIRETCEELGIHAGDLHMIGQSDIFVTTHSIIYPFIFQLNPNVELHPDPYEVHDLFTVPMDFLMEHEPELYLVPIEVKPPEDFPYDVIPGGKYYKWRKANMPEYFYRYQDKVIWGMTARILRDFLSRIQK